MKYFYKDTNDTLCATTEKMNYSFSRVLDLDIAPPTITDGKHIYQLAMEDVVHFDKNNFYYIRLTNEYHRATVFDYISQQKDRHRDNIFVSKTDGKIILIDNEFSFHSNTT
tara:strand:+ start:1057 stop:1389 length:333 start_codon:yes stop_codon:yes gene_type:complete